LIADDHAVVRKGLAMVLRLEPDFEVVGEAGDGLQALALTAQLRPDIVMLDRMMPLMDGGETALALRAQFPEVKILVLTGTEIDRGVLDLLAAGVDGYVLKDIEPQELKEAIRAVVRGEAYLHPAVARQVMKRMKEHVRGAPKSPLTARELEVLHWLSTPNTYRQIAQLLNVGEETARSHAKSILNKLDQPNRAQAVLAALRAGLIELPEA
jgi:DNA-binding NarL/FixJ family response regulator